jgi:hypothetical protein
MAPLGRLSYTTAKVRLQFESCGVERHLFGRQRIICALNHMSEMYRGRRAMSSHFWVILHREAKNHPFGWSKQVTGGLVRESAWRFCRFAQPECAAWRRAYQTAGPGMGFHEHRFSCVLRNTPMRSMSVIAIFRQLSSGAQSFLDLHSGREDNGCAW